MTVASQRTEDAMEVRLYTKRGITLTHGNGMYLFDSEGRRYLDAMSNYGVNILGHRHPVVDTAIREQLDRLLSCHQSFYNDARAGFEQRLTAQLPSSLGHIAFANSGTEAVEAAMKFARLASGKTRIISAEHGYHGRTLGALSVTGVSKYQAGFGPLLPACESVPFDDINALRASIPGAAAVILEPIQGESGVLIPDPGYLTAARELCDEFDVLLILDEIQTGMGRTGRLLAFDHEGVIPDIVTISKGLANGLPMGVTIVSNAIAGKIPSGAHGSTFAGNPLACAAASAVITTVTGAGFLESVAKMGERFAGSLQALAHPLIHDVRGRGLMVAVELKTRITPVLRAMQENGVLALPAGSRTIRFLPPLIIEAEHVDEIVRVLGVALAYVAPK